MLPALLRAQWSCHAGLASSVGSQAPVLLDELRFYLKSSPNWGLSKSPAHLRSTIRPAEPNQGLPSVMWIFLCSLFHAFWASWDPSKDISSDAILSPLAVSTHLHRPLRQSELPYKISFFWTLLSRKWRSLDPALCIWASVLFDVARWCSYCIAFNLFYLFTAEGRFWATNINSSMKGSCQGCHSFMFSGMEAGRCDGGWLLTLTENTGNEVLCILK